ncbi:MAG: 1,4-alpha-glucan branching enzyme [Solirubrobacteraceae bacterium]|nr:1,4-alpha-glucan branching enzyme [Solirubrobacteraceae bacterium]
MTRRLSLVLHTHLPYVEGFGTWPFGEEWLWEAMATCYLPLLDVLDEYGGPPTPVTVSLTPVLADQLAAPGVPERFVKFLRGIREHSHALDAEAHPDVVPQLEHSLHRYRRAAAAFERRAGDLVAAFAPHATWTSAATHAVLPLLATDRGIDLQVGTGVASHRARFGAPAGFWLPECAHAPWVLPRVEGVSCVELPGHDPRVALRAHQSLVLAPLDRALIDLVWGADGYPARAPYLDTRRFTERRHLAWSVAGDPYDPDAAREQARADAQDFADRLPEGWSVVALDTELLGHWWAEGIDWLAALIETGVELVSLDAAYGEDAAAAGELPITTWGRDRTLATWSGPRAQGLAWRQRAAELRVLSQARPSARALRELLALQSSDWAFLVAEDTAGPYPLERAAGHERAIDTASERSEVDGPALRNLAPFLS